MVEKDHNVVPEPDDREDYTRLRERAPEILEVSRKNPPEDDKNPIEKKDDSEIEERPGGTGW